MVEFGTTCSCGGKLNHVAVVSAKADKNCGSPIGFLSFRWGGQDCPVAFQSFLFRELVLPESQTRVGGFDFEGSFGPEVRNGYLCFSVLAQV